MYSPTFFLYITDTNPPPHHHPHSLTHSLILTLTHSPLISSFTIYNCVSSPFFFGLIDTQEREVSWLAGILYTLHYIQYIICLSLFSLTLLLYIYIFLFSGYNHCKLCSSHNIWSLIFLSFFFSSSSSDSTSSLLPSTSSSCLFLFWFAFLN